MVKQGFTRVFITSQNRTTRIRTDLANNPNYMNEYGLVIVRDAEMPQIHGGYSTPVDLTSFSQNIQDAIDAKVQAALELERAKSNPLIEAPRVFEGNWVEANTPSPHITVETIAPITPTPKPVTPPAPKSKSK